MENLLIYLHIPKTGGTTLRDIIQYQYKSNKILTIPTLSESKDIINNLSLIAFKFFIVFIPNFYFSRRNFIIAK